VDDRSAWRRRPALFPFNDSYGVAAARATEDPAETPATFGIVIRRRVMTAILLEFAPGSIAVAMFDPQGHLDDPGLVHG
jgi:hypothetical protein